MWEVTRLTVGSGVPRDCGPFGPATGHWSGVRNPRIAVGGRAAGWDNRPMPADLDRFVQAQRGVYEGALDELRRGRKTSHWMWFIFPQIEGLGHSEMAELYAIESLDEARAYLDHPVLGPRLRACATAILTVSARTAEEILGPIDAVKLRSSMTLFLRAAPDEPVFAEVLDRWYGGVPDAATDARLSHAEA